MSAGALALVEKKALVTDEEYATAYTEGFHRTIGLLVHITRIDKEEATEIAQAAWVKGWEHRDQLESASHIAQWVNRIAINLFNDDRRRQPAQFCELSEFLGLHYYQDFTSKIDLGLILKLCSNRDRLLLQLRLSGLMYSEIAEEVGSIKITARTKLFKIYRKLRRLSTKERALFRKRGATER